MPYVLKTLGVFTGANGADPIGGLTLDPTGNIFGTTAVGGTSNLGTVFEIPRTPDGYGSITTLASFTDATGGKPLSALTLDASGNLFGLTEVSGSRGYGASFEIPQTGSGYGSIVPLYPQGNGPGPPLLLSDGSAYYVTYTASDGGNVIRVRLNDPSTATQIYTFGNPVASPFPNGLVRAPNGDLFGTTNRAGTYSDGTLFQAQYDPQTDSFPNTAYISFSGQNGQFPSGGLVIDSAGNLFGTTRGGSASNGTVFEVPKNGSQYNIGYLSTIATFGGTSALGDSPTSLFLGADDTLYGTTSSGGANNAGTFFKLSKTSSGYGPPTKIADFPAGFPAIPLTTDNLGNLFGVVGSSNGGTVYEFMRTARLDLNCNGRSDILFRRASDGVAYLYTMNDATDEWRDAVDAGRQ